MQTGSATARSYSGAHFDLVFPRLVTRGLLLAHNVVNKQAEMKDFLAAIQDNDAVMTTVVSPSGEGMSVSLKLSR